MIRPAGKVDTCGATCAICCRNHVYLGDFTLNGSTPGEQWDELTPHLNGKGWQVRTNARGKREVVCPNCITVLDDRATKPLPAYEPGKACPKCGYPQVAPKFYTGLEPDAALGVVRDHLLNTCQRCQYAYVTRTADANPSWWRRIFRRAK